MDRSTQTHDEDFIIKDKNELVIAEGKNALLQFDAGMAIVEQAMANCTDKKFVLDLKTICSLNEVVMKGIHKNAGKFRSAPIGIENSSHIPPPHHDVPGLMDELCKYVNVNWDSATPIHLASYVMWRLNWVHPFSEGNGRTSRIVSYIVLCIRLGVLLPGTPTIPDQIAANRQRYYAALTTLDGHHKKNKMNLMAMEELLSDLLHAQLRSIENKATGGEVYGSP